MMLKNNTFTHQCELQKLPSPPSKKVQYWSVDRPNHRAGVVFMDYEHRKVLVVQSYNVHWGFPKGSKDEDESFLGCAIRELREETGIVITPEDVSQTIPMYNNTVYYYVVKFDPSKFKIDTTEIDTTEITGIGWICVDCLHRGMCSGELLVNSHVRKLLYMLENELTGKRVGWSDRFGLLRL